MDIVTESAVPTVGAGVFRIVILSCSTTVMSSCYPSLALPSLKPVAEWSFRLFLFPRNVSLVAKGYVLRIMEEG